jgi:hypothetical protein
MVFGPCVLADRAVAAIRTGRNGGVRDTHGFSYRFFDT